MVKFWHDERAPPRTDRSAFVLVSIALVCSLLLNILSFSFTFWQDLPVFADPPSTPEHGFLPIELREVSMTVQHSSHYGLHDDEGWHSLIAKGHGFVRLPLDSLNASSPNTYYSVSLYHSLHCLNGIRRFTVSSMDGTPSKHAYDHVAHCLSYLRQLALCHADTALEPAITVRTTTGDTSQLATGFGTTHRCRDWTQVREFAERNYEGWKKEDTHETSDQVCRAAFSREVHKVFYPQVRIPKVRGLTEANVLIIGICY